MLKLDFFGQQNRLANHQGGTNALMAADVDRWAAHLGNASFEKVFPLRNRWTLRQLSLRELLMFPHEGPQSFKAILDGWGQQPAPNAPELDVLGEYLNTMAGTIEDPIEFESGWTYRSAHQLFEQLNGETSETDQAGASETGNTDTSGVGSFQVPNAEKRAAENRAAEAIGRILGGADYDEFVRRTERSDTGSDPRIEYLDAGRLEAFFPGEVTEEILEEDVIVLSALPGFRYSEGVSSQVPAANGIREDRARKTSAQRSAFKMTATVSLHRDLSGKLCLLLRGRKCASRSSIWPFNGAFTGTLRRYVFSTGPRIGGLSCISSGNTRNCGWSGSHTRGSTISFAG